MLDARKFYINGAWVNARERATLPVINPATEAPFAEIAAATPADVDAAVKAARKSFPSFAATRIDDRSDLLRALYEIYKRRSDEIGEILCKEMGAPIDMAIKSQAPAGRRHIRTTLRSLRHFKWERLNRDETTRIVYEPIGVCGLITPWNWPMNQIVAKVAPALATGCTVVLKPSEIAPLSALLFAEMIDEAGFPAGVFNLVTGDGEHTGAALSAHPDVDMVSFTGSVRGGKAVTIAAAETIKRVALELGGKSPNIIFADADVARAVKRGVRSCFYNTGQSCNLPSRMLVEASVFSEACELAARVTADTKVDDPLRSGSHIGPLASAAQYARVQSYIAAGIEEGATLLAGGLGKPAGIERGYFVRPTVFTNVQPSMRIFREEIFGPVLCLLPFKDEEEALQLANDTPYGLSSYVHSGDSDRADRVARRLRAGTVQINGASHSSDAPFGGYKQSGNGREFGEYGMREFLELKSISGR